MQSRTSAPRILARRLTRWIVTSLVATSLAVPARAEPAALSPEAREALDALLAATMAADHLPSLSVAIFRDRTLVYASAVGLADIENAVPATPRTVYAVGSVTKPLTAVAAMQLAEAGKLDLDAPIQTYCPGYPRHEQPITSRLLLAHLAGVRGYDYRRFEQDFLNRTTYPSLELAMAKFRDDPLVASPGSQYTYSSWGYVLVGCAIETAAGTTYGEQLRRSVLEPAGMTQARLDVPGALVPFRAHGYGAAEDGGWKNATCFNPSDRYPAGGLLATPTDLGRFGAALLAGELVGGDARAAMWAPQTTTGGEQTGYGLGWNLEHSTDPEVFHGGTSVGATAYLYLRPHQRLVVAFATNLELWNQGRHELARRLADLAVGSPAGDAR